MLQIILKCYMIFICFYVCRAESFDNKEGSGCTAGDYNGTCINIYKCFQMIQVLADKKKPEICSFDGKVPIVCCTECSEFHVANISNAILEPQLGILWKNGRKSWDKCLDYINNNPYPCRRHFISELTYYWQEDKKCHAMGISGVGAAGGVDAHQGELPHMVLLGYGEDLETAQWLCGGSLISETFILTAAHCIASPSLGPVEFAALGILKRSDPPEMWQRYSIKRRIAHPDYKSPSKYHDIALLETTTPIKFSWLVLPACLPVDPVDNTYADAAGWGALGHREQLANVLQKVHLNRFSHEECSKIYQPHRHLLNGYNGTTQMCFGDHDHSKDTCEGDSGGPLFLSNGCRFDVIGVTSYGVACGFKGNAGVYTRVEHYVPWIESVVWP